MNNENEFYIRHQRIHKIADPDNPLKTIDKPSEIVTYEPVEQFEPFRLDGIDHSFAIVTNCTRPYVRVINDELATDGEIGWRVSAVGQFARNKTFRDLHRPIVCKGLAALLLKSAKMIRGVWRIDSERIEGQYRMNEEQGAEFTEQELVEHQQAERGRWEQAQAEAKKWLPFDLYDLLHRRIELYCNCRIVDPDARDAQLVEMLKGDTTSYDLLIEKNKGAKNVSQLGRIVKMIISGKDIELKGFVDTMMQSGKFEILNNGKTLDNNYKTIWKAANR